MQYQANPFIVSASPICKVTVRSTDDDIPFALVILEDGGQMTMHPRDLASDGAPRVGDYWVQESKERSFWLSKELFEHRYSPMQKQKAA